MKIAFVHQNCPGQFAYLAPFLAADKNNEVVFITQPGKPTPAGVRKVEYSPKRKPAESTHHYLRLTESGILNGQAVAMKAVELRDSGFYPDIVVAHMGWGEGLYLKEVWPQAPLLGYFEWFYHARGADVGFADSKQVDLETACRIETRNCMHLQSLTVADHGISPTHWQRLQHPVEFHKKISIIHDGVNTELLKPDATATITVDGTELKAGDEVITYVARNLEPYRGFPSFMKAVEIILKRRPNAHVVVVGGDDVGYGSAPPDGKTYRQHALENGDFDMSRLHFLGRVPYAEFVRILQVSAAHVYLTVPFVLSWSVLEAMSAGCVVIGSRTAPVAEVIEHEKNGLLVDFFSPEEIADQVDRVLSHPDRMQVMRDAARETILQRYDLKKCLHSQIQLMSQMVQFARQKAGAPKKAKVAATAEPQSEAAAQ
ncbi:MAG: glycosyltransferase family 4 protein [Gammaproteobacteria bacterium]|nr:glycosyltransferase family 4 protein [Gammaproteobacteria bacterium]MCP5439046.1 glycosyltransferase [Chromatiaceae bacterium]HOP15746.1 glycosyltransferase family 4 protein [Gammaproteobacteria bacterium]